MLHAANFVVLAVKIKSCCTRGGRRGGADGGGESHNSPSRTNRRLHFNEGKLAFFIPVLFFFLIKHWNRRVVMAGSVVCQAFEARRGAGGSGCKTKRFKTERVSDSLF